MLARAVSLFDKKLAQQLVYTAMISGVRTEAYRTCRRARVRAPLVLHQHERRNITDPITQIHTQRSFLSPMIIFVCDSLVYSIVHIATKIFNFFLLSSACRWFTQVETEMRRVFCQSDIFLEQFTVDRRDAHHVHNHHVDNCCCCCLSNRSTRT